MSAIGNSNGGLAALFAPASKGSPASNGKPAPATDESFSASLTLKLAEFRAQNLGTLMSSVFGNQSAADGFGAPQSGSDPLAGLGGSQAGASANSSGLGGLSADGRNSSLFDPESAYRMMSVISQKDVTYKAQFAELSAMKTELDEMEGHGERLGQIDQSASAASIKEKLAAFVTEYNEWSTRFDADMEKGGLLADTQAAQVSRYELKQSIENRFFGVAGGGVRGLGELGVTIDPVSKQASLDTAKLDAVLATNKAAAVATVQEFGANFAKSAGLLISQGNFIENRLDNLDRVIDYIDDNKTSLQAEFGRGDPARPTGQVAQALAAYQQMKLG